MYKLLYTQSHSGRRFSLLAKIIAVLVIILLLLTFMVEFKEIKRDVPIDVNKMLESNTPSEQELQSLENSDTTDNTAFIDLPLYSYEIQSGDSLSGIFARLGVPYSDLISVMEIDQNHLALDTLNPGDVVNVWMDDQQAHLSKLELEFTLANKVRFIRVEGEDSYIFEEVNLPGIWKTFTRMGEIHGSFSQSVFKEGISTNETAQIVSLLKEKINLSRDLRAGDRFEILQKKQFIDDMPTGNRQIEAIRLYTRGKVISAYLHEDGQYYDRQGQGLQRAFLRWPVKRHYRISSGFNPKRLHPVTGRVSPHNGVDLATPVGVEVIATGDGEVLLTRNHPYAGKYIVIRHSAKYITRYLHLDKILVKKGQKIQRGQVIAKSGATGRITGPHLHYEFIIDNRPVDFLKADIPMATQIPSKEKAAFNASIKAIDQQFAQAKQTLASNQG